MKMRMMVAGLALVAVVAVGCGSKQAEPAAPASNTNTAVQPATTTTPAAQSPSSTPASTPDASASGKKYAVVAANSTASYSVGERFFGKDVDVTAVGKTSGFVGEIVLAGGVIKPSVIQVDLSVLKSDEDRRDNRVRQALDTATHKYAVFSITGAEGNPVLKEGQEVTLKLQGNMKIKGTEKPVVFDTKAKLSGDTLTLNATTNFTMTQFGVTPPNILNFVSVKDEVKLDIAYVGKTQ